MQMTILPAAAGWQWMTRSFSLVFRYPLQTTLSYFAFIAILMILSFIPLVSILASVLGPLVVVGIMTLWRDLEQGRGLSTQAFLRPFNECLTPLLIFSVIYMAASLIVFLVTLAAMFLLMGKDVLVLLEAFFQNPEALDPAQGLEILLKFLLGFLIFLVLLIPVLMAYWFAPLLIAWHQVPVGKAIFFSFVACLKNWRALLINGLAVMGFSLVFGILISILSVLLALLLPKSIGIYLLFLLLVILGIVFSTVVFANFYYSNIGVFPPESAALETQPRET
jgi:hypothetical protein